MLKYIAKRLLLMVPTFMGATFMVFCILAVVPGGPFEKAVMQLQMQNMMEGGEVSSGGGNDSGSTKLTPEQLEQLRQQYGLDKPLITRYLIWLGFYPREVKSGSAKLGEAFRDDLEYIQEGKNMYVLQRWIKPVEENGQVKIYESGVGSDFKFSDDYPELPSSDAITQWFPSSDWDFKETKEGKAKLIQTAFSGIFTGDLGTSYEYDKPVTTLIKERLHISAYFGIISFILTYLICIPLGIYKAVYNGSKFDLLSSVVIFIGYAIPGFALGALLLVLFGGGTFLDIFPLGGFRSPNWDELSFFGKIWDQFLHSVLPIIAYMVGAFATLTILMKNSMMDNLGQDYVRTAFAKGLPEKKVIFKHALRNSLIPIATGLGHFIGLFLMGSYLIEKVFNIDGLGLLSYNSIVESDFPFVLGYLVINIVLLLIGNLLSDMFYVLIDPRIQFS